MKVYGSVTLSEGSDLNNLTVAHGSAFPANPNVGELFYHDSFGFVYHDGIKWNPLSTDIHVFNDSFSLNLDQNDFVAEIHTSTPYKSGSTQLYVSGIRQKLGIDYNEIDGKITLNYNLSITEINDGANIVLDFIKAGIS